MSRSHTEMSRKQAREWMMQVYYQMDVLKDFDPDHEDSILTQKKMDEQEDYCRTLYRVLIKHKDLLDHYIDSFSIGWKIDRMAKTDLAILRLAAAEILYMSDIPVAVSINEAVGLAKRYGTDESPRFINAILAKVADVDLPEDQKEEGNE
ncbi:MAG: transcription antitermination factor NusB [Eubacterium sp.]|nr:transcription antitermination factor NusB [Eubacterium sp.]MCH4047660.1 transcription antitermination factor NusB [Eubacterium sp.]MCH4078432.1 transcription antitermination factor NusB [Eubacterium sp.]MCH4109576.1 transcription antitermination factor NusB [Eubacterium sp.]MCI1306672.1 transcription antitermination factor NusB [Eubacterium sp.]